MPMGTRAPLQLKSCRPLRRRAKTVLRALRAAKPRTLSMRLRWDNILITTEIVLICVIVGLKARFRGSPRRSPGPREQASSLVCRGRHRSTRRLQGGLCLGIKWLSSLPFVLLDVLPRHCIYSVLFLHAFFSRSGYRFSSSFVFHSSVFPKFQRLYICFRCLSTHIFSDPISSAFLPLLSPAPLTSINQPLACHGP